MMMGGGLLLRLPFFFFFVFRGFFFCAVQLRCKLAIRAEPKAEPDRHAHAGLGGPEFEIPPDYHFGGLPT